MVACVRLSLLLKAEGFPIAGMDAFFTHSSVDRSVCLFFSFLSLLILLEALIASSVLWDYS